MNPEDPEHPEPDRSVLEGKICPKCLAPANKVMEWKSYQPANIADNPWLIWICVDCGNEGFVVDDDSKVTPEKEGKMAKECKHDKYHSSEALMSNPPQYPWICRKCGEEGRDIGEYEDHQEYDRLREKSLPNEELKIVVSSSTVGRVDNIPDRITLDPGFVIGKQNNIPRVLITFDPDGRVVLNLEAIKKYLNEQRLNAHD